MQLGNLGYVPVVSTSIAQGKEKLGKLKVNHTKIKITKTFYIHSESPSVHCTIVISNIMQTIESLFTLISWNNE